MYRAGDVISYPQLCHAEGVSLQRGMNFRLKGVLSVVLMSVRAGAPYADRVEEDGRVLIYEGHDQPRQKGEPDPKTLDQLAAASNGSLTQNGLFLRAAEAFKGGQSEAEIVRVYEKVKKGIWVFNGSFRLTDGWEERINNRCVFKFRLEIIQDGLQADVREVPLEHNRLIPSKVKLEVWKRDQGRCVKCGSVDNLHFDHLLPFSKGGTSLLPENIQILCARHNLGKGSKLE